MAGKERLPAAAAASLAAVALAACNPLSRPSLEPYAPLRTEPVAPPAGRFEAYFLGTSTLVFSDGATRIMIDGFFSRPGLLQALRPIEPNAKRIGDGLRLGGIGRGGKVDAIFVAHGHHDHAMDSAFVAKTTEALLAGSRTVANVARGERLPRERICVIEGDRERFTWRQLGRFTVTAVRTPHAPSIPFEGNIDKPLDRPAWLPSFKEGGNYSFLIEHPGGEGEPPRKMLVVTSGGVERGMFKGLPEDIDIVFLAIGKLGRQTPNYVADYWQEAVSDRHARIAILIHWDDIRLPLFRKGRAQEFRAIPRFQDDLHKGMRQIMPMAVRDGVKLNLPKRGGRVDVQPPARSGEATADGQSSVAPETPCRHPEF